MPSPQPFISRVELLLASMPFSAERRVTSEESIDEYNASSQAFTQMESLMVKVQDSQGRIGWGEAFGHKSNPASWAALEEIVGPFALGRSTDPATFRREAEYAFHAFGRTGPVHYALSAVDTALWDLAAQARGKTLRWLIGDELGTEPSDQIDCYASLVHYGEDPTEVAHHTGRAREAGFTAFKLHESTAPAVQAARRSVGDDAALMTDVNCHWDDFTEATAALEALAPFNLHWMEEPVFPPDDYHALHRLNSAYGHIAAGENASGVQGLVHLMEIGAISAAQPSVGKIGGVSAMIEVIRAGAEHGCTVAPHCFYYGPALSATAQIVAAMGETVLLESPFLTWPAVLHTLQGAGPHIVLDQSPGLGFVPDDAVLGEHLIRSSTVS